MLIKSLEVHNFRQFFGTNKIEFETNLDKNVTIVIGDNTTGKTTLLQAFSWCLYEEANLPKKKQLLNLDIAKDINQSKNTELWVEVVVLYKERIYNIKRKNIYARSVTTPIEQIVTVSFKGEHGKAIDLDGLSAQNKIKEILPDGLSHCFFFDNERISNITQKKEISNSVESLLGLKVISNAIDHLGSSSKADTMWFKGNTVIGSLRNEIAHTDKEEKERLLKEINNDQQCLENNLKKKDEFKKNIVELNSLTKDSQESLDRNKTIIEENSKKKVIEKEIDLLKEQLLQKQKEYLELFSKKFYKIQGASLFKKITSKISNHIEYSSEYLITDETLIDSIIKKGVCLCGTILIENSEKYKNILDFKEKAHKNKINIEFKQFSIVAKNNYLESITLIESEKELYHSIQVTIDEISNKEIEIDEINESLKGKKNVSYLIDEITNNRDKINNHNRNIENIDGQNKRLEKQISDNNQALDQLIEYDKKNKIIFKCIMYANKIRDQYEVYFEEQKESIRKLLEINVNTIFNRMFTGQRKAVIKDNYDLSLLYIDSDDNEESESIESPGLTTVKNFAFITGLVKTARDKMEEKNADSLTSDIEPFPLVMDAPFSNADEHHVKKISKILPEIAEQIIFFTMKKDWDIAKHVMPKVGKSYTLKKQTETKTTIHGGINVS